MKVLIDAGASLNSPERNGLCPLHIAIQRRFYAGVYLLLSKGMFSLHTLTLFYYLVKVYSSSKFF